MADLIDLITDQDIEAYVDGAVSGHRHCAVEKRLINDERAMGKAIRTLRLSADLREVRHVIYKNPDLRTEIETLLSAARGSRRGALAR